MPTICRPVATPTRTVSTTTTGHDNRLMASGTPALIDHHFMTTISTVNNYTARSPPP
jgi:hypothetical protein